MGQVRWPFGPPHLTLKPSKKKQERKKNKEKKQGKSKNTQSEIFQLSVKIFVFWVSVQNLPFLTTWPKNAHPKTL